MKTAWNIITLVALANLIAIVGFIWWLHFSGRLDMGRVEEVRAMMSETLAEESRRESTEKAETEAAEAAAAEAELMQSAPVSAGDTLAMRLEASEIDQQRLERLRQDVDALRTTLARERRVFEQERQEYLAEKEAFERMRERLAEIEGDEQFAKSVAVLDTMKAAEARDLLGELLNEDEQQVVAYLNAMKPRQRTKVISEFNKAGQVDVATDLLEQLRTLGLEAETQ